MDKFASILIFARLGALRRIRGLSCAELTCERLALHEASHTASGALPLRNPRLIPFPLIRFHNTRIGRKAPAG